MKNKTFPIMTLLLLSLLTACAGKPSTPTVVELAASATPTVVATATLDPCSEAALPGEVTKINDLMREFDDYSRLASSTPQEQLVQVIPSLQEVRRRAESQEVPQCLVNLKNLQLAHMNTVIEILMVFMGNAQAEGVNPGIAQARDLHMKYDIEIARLLGVTLVPPPTAIPVTPVPTQP
jgi:hypothetical protein